MKVAITGISSFLASSIVPYLEKDSNIEEILGIDIVEPQLSSSKIKFVKRDVRDKEIEENLKGCDSLIHLAFIVNPRNSVKEMYSINLDGSKNVFDCAINAGIKKIVHASSVAAYGSFPDNPIPITEDFPIRKMKKDFYYHDTKYYVEKYLDKLESKYPDVSIIRLRPHVFFGKNINNFFRDFFGKKKIYGLSSDNPWQFVWVGDVAQAFYLALIKDVSGIFNIGGDNYLSIREMGKKLNRKVLNIPYRLSLALTTFAQKLHLLKIDLAGWIRISRYPIIVDSNKAKKVLGWKPKYDTFGTVKFFLSQLKELGEVE